MDLIYADALRKDIGVLSAYSLDMAYGADENDFECTVAAGDHCCDVGYFIYAEGTEYGGIVDRIKVDTEKGEVTYIGRTWHGILESHVICPESGYDYLTVSGEMNEVLQDVIENLNLSSLFIASTDDTETEVTNYDFDRYCYGYTGIRKLLKEYDMKLQVSWEDNMIVLSAVPVADYSQDEEFDTSQIDFSIEKNYRPVNHIIALGQGNLKNRYVIHLFTDENGGIQDYLTNMNSEPVEDSDYILTTENQVLFDQDEVAEVYDASNAEIATNYVLLTSQPSDWTTNSTKYYTYTPEEGTDSDETVDDGGSYDAVQLVSIPYKLLRKEPYDWDTDYDDYYEYSNGSYSAVTGESTYNLLTSKPGNWATAYGRYYKLSGSSYVAVTGTTTTNYVRQRKAPKDWKKNYSTYYFKYSDGVTTEFRTTEALTFSRYKRQTKRPTDWTTSFSSYYRRATAKELKKAPKVKFYNVEKTKKKTVPRWKKKKYFTRKTYYKAPAWKKVTRYTKVTKTVAPTWESGTYYHKVGLTAPTWEAGTYYKYVNLRVAPTWKAETYYRQTLDHYAALVEGALDRLEELNASDEMSIDLEETDQTYDVGDIVGTTEQVTGIEATQEVIKKIITIQNDNITIKYEVG